MVKLRLLNKASGISKASGKPWTRITLGSDHSDGSRSVADFFVTPEIAAKLVGISLDSQIYVHAELDDKLHFGISDIRSSDSSMK